MTATESALQPTATLMGMEAARRWETEAIRESRDRRRARPTVSQQRTTPNSAGDWRTLREASDATGIPIGTLRKWCRRESVDSYLESDGEQTLRMLEMGSVEAHAEATGRDLNRGPETTDNRQQTDPVPPSEPVLSTQYSVPSTASEAGSTMIVPVDAWNKMLTQLGNLHEAGQQLAEARERAGKAETEAKFLRERLAEVRQDTSSKTQEDASSKTQVARSEEDETVLSTQYSVHSTRSESDPVPPAASSSSPVRSSSSSPSESSSSPSESSSSPSGGGAERSEAEGVKASNQLPAASDQPETVSFFRYVVRGWRGRKR